MSEQIRRNAVTCALAGIAAVDPGDLVRRALAEQPVAGRVTLVAIGKAAGGMAAATLAALGDAVRRGVLIAPAPVEIDGRINCFVGGHPIPNQSGADAARAIVDIVRQLHPEETLLCLISGGASALMTLPPDGISVSDAGATADILLRAGATIQQLNCVRKHLDQLKGGRLAALAFPSTVIALVLSDVVGDSLATIASGPTVADPTTVADALTVLRDLSVLDTVPASVRAYLESGSDESPKPGDARMRHSVSRVIGSNVTAADAACSQARALGYTARVVTTSLTGEARLAGADIARAARAECDSLGCQVALIFAGETTVTVSGAGVGGRNQELVLGAAIAMDGLAGIGDIAVASLGTDGIDGPTDAAGAVADANSMTRARSLGLDPAVALANNDAYTFWKALGALVRTGPTGTNVMDVVVALVVPATA